MLLQIYQITINIRGNYYQNLQLRGFMNRKVKQQLQSHMYLKQLKLQVKQ